jgi:hypothetical protein
LRPTDGGAILQAGFEGGLASGLGYVTAPALAVLPALARNFLIGGAGVVAAAQRRRSRPPRRLRRRR